MAPVYFIDFEAFQHGDEDFCIKEMCILSVEKPLKPLYMLFKPTKSWNDLSPLQQRTYVYQEHRLHHLSWNEGLRRYCNHCVFRDLEKEIPTCTLATFYVLGDQKTEFLRNQLPLLNIVQYDHVTSYKELPNAPSHLTCLYRHHSKEHCAVLKCYRLYLHYLSL